jgi:hypothetical protein
VFFPGSAGIALPVGGRLIKTQKRGVCQPFFGLPVKNPAKRIQKGKAANFSGFEKSAQF